MRIPSAGCCGGNGRVGAGVDVTDYVDLGEYESKLDSLFAEAQGLGPLTPGLVTFAKDMYSKVIAGQFEQAIKEALSQGLAAGGAAVCTVVGAGVLAPICAIVGEQFGYAIGAAVWGDEADVTVNPAEVRTARFNALYGALMAQVPDDRQGGGTIYNKAANQLAVICNLYVDGVVFGPDGTEQIDKALIGNQDWQLGPDTHVKAGGPESMFAHYTDDPRFANPDAELAWLRTTNGLAFWEPTLVEFKNTPEGALMRRHLWNFYSLHGGYGQFDTILGKMFLERAVSRVLVAANVMREQKFLRAVSDMARLTQDYYLPLCQGFGPCIDSIKGESVTGAYDVLFAARGVGGVPALLADASRYKLEAMVGLAEAWKLNNLDENEYIDKVAQKINIYVPPTFFYNPSLTYGPTTADDAAPGGAGSDESSALPAVLGVAALAALGWVGWRTYKGKPVLPKF